MKAIKKIFIVDDDPIHRLLMNKLFEKQGAACSLNFFENGQKAMTALENAISSHPDQIPDLILLDIEMPVMNGWQFMNAYQKLDPILHDQVGIYMVSSSFSDDDQKKVKLYPAIKDYIVKPLRIDRISEFFK